MRGPLAQFEYMFDNADQGHEAAERFGWVKSTKEGHEKTLEANQLDATKLPETGMRSFQRIPNEKGGTPLPICVI